jgi:energy-coupling factor transporter transmembrane protein EcfT
MNVMHGAPVAKGISCGILFSCSAGIVYILLLHEPGFLFYPFAALVFLIGPLIAGAAGAAGSPGDRYRALLISGGAVFAAALLLFFMTYGVLPHFDRTSVQLPESCTGFSGSPHPSPALAWELPGTGTGVLLASDDQTAVVAMIESANAPYPSSVYVVNRSDNRTLRRMQFADDILIATIDSGVVYLYHDKLGYLINARTGAPEETFLKIDNYGGLSASDRPVLAGSPEGRRYLETSAVISSWSTDGTVRSRTRLTMNALAYNCFVNGKTGEITGI